MNICKTTEEHSATSTRRASLFHCDIKPSNILVTASLEPKLADFGLGIVGPPLLASSAVEHEQDRPRGTCTFRAPEVLSGGASGRRRYRLAAADVWSLACVLACIGRRSKQVYADFGSDRASSEEAERRVAARQLRPSLPPAPPFPPSAAPTRAARDRCIGAHKKRREAARQQKHRRRFSFCFSSSRSSSSRIRARDPRRSANTLKTGFERAA